MIQIDKARLENYLDLQNWYEAAVLLTQDGDIGRLRECLAQTWRRGKDVGYSEGYARGFSAGYDSVFFDGESGEQNKNDS